MEEKSRETTPAANPQLGPPETLAEGSRRRASGPKRKGPAGSSSSSSSTSAKRLAKERNPLPFVTYVHNGPVTRARQSPNKFAAAGAAAPQNLAEQLAALDVAGAAGSKEGEVAGAQFAGEDEMLDIPDEPVVDEEFESVRSRGSNVHVIPTHAGWFAWGKIHPLEEQTMVSFFNGKSEKRTSDIYKNIRNSIMEKFHNDPQTEIELKLLSELEFGDMDARQEVMEFLDHWGLINFHPFPPSTSDISAPNTDGTAKTPASSERLYQFESVHPAPRLAPKTVNPSAPAMPPRLFPESAITDDLVRPEGPSVEYHCNSCSADCSRKRYHCQKQADFDLCTECYNNGKFGSGMTPADFILMEPAEIPGTGGGSWTDQETLLLLEALELYGENWNEIAEHVATKTKTQCMLHFVQMPIEDTFLEDTDNTHNSLSSKSDHVLTSKILSASDAPEKIEDRTTENEERNGTFPASISKEKDGCQTKSIQGPSYSCIAINALRAAFQTIGSLPEDGVFSFADAGNPVMALAAFLVALVDRDLALTSSRSSLKAISENSPGIQLATRHCFTLEDPPKHRIDQHTSESEGAQKDEPHVPVMNGTDEPQSSMDKNDEVAVPKNNVSVSSEECAQSHIANKSTDLDVSIKETVPVIESSTLSLRGGKVVRRNIKDPRDVSLPNDKAVSRNDNNLGDQDPHGVSIPNFTKESGELPADEVTSGTNMESKAMSLHSPKEGDFALPGEQPRDAVKDSSDAMAFVEGNKQFSETSRPVVESTEVKEHQNAVDSSSAVSTRDPTGEDYSTAALSNGEMTSKSFKTEDDSEINKIRRAAVTALSAAAVNAKLLANQEEDQIRQLVSLIVEKQLQKLEIKLALFSEIESVIVRVREQIDRARQRLIHERAQIIAARLGLPASSSRSIPASLPATKFAVTHGFSGSRSLSLSTQKSPIRRQ